MKIALIGVSGLRNRGMEALVAVLVDGLKARHPDARIRMFTKVSDYEKRYCAGDPCVSLESSIVEGATDRLRAVIGRVAAPRLHPHFATLRGADLIVFTGGDVLTDSYGPGSYEHFLRQLELAIATGRPVAAPALSAGPLPKGASPVRLLRAFERLAHLSFREERSLAFARSIGLRRDAPVVPDLAVLLRPTERPAAVPPVLIAPSMGFARWSGLDGAAHLDALARFAGHALREWGAPVGIVAHTHERNPEADDRRIAAELAERIGGAPVVYEEDQPAAWYKARLASAEFVLAERMHAAVGAFSSGVPGMVLAYSLKAHGLAGLVGSPGEGGPPPCADSKELLEGDTWIDRTDAIWRERQRWRVHLAEVSAAWRRGAESVLDSVAEAAR
ncbi:MAG: polysaccharide pyruvyl transferase family protein [Candidatus Sumerlaeia bacterium]|nr:polysaccharide pyruvyl transferase family protein [Candidatus Sumerlaeia bacterium]